MAKSRLQFYSKPQSTLKAAARSVVFQPVSRSIRANCLSSRIFSAAYSSSCSVGGGSTLNPAGLGLSPVPGTLLPVKTVPAMHSGWRWFTQFALVYVISEEHDGLGRLLTAMNSMWRYLQAHAHAK